MDLASIEVRGTVNIRDIAQKKTQEAYGRKDIDDSFFVCNVGDIVNKHRRWLEIFPRVHPYFAFKACPYEPVIRCLASVGAGFDCASKAEIESVLECGADPNRIIFANTCKQQSHVKFAKEKGVRKVVADSKAELEKMGELFPEAEIVLRMKVDDTSSTAPLSSKFGASVDECRNLIQDAYYLGLQITGICFHVGSGCNDDRVYVETLTKARSLFDFAKDVGYTMTLLDIGGGFPGVCRASLTVEKIAETVAQALDKFFPAEEWGNLQVIAEPGRYYAASALALVTNIIGKRRVTVGGKSKIEYFINDGIFGAFRFKYENHENEMNCSPLADSEADADFKGSTVSKIWGPTCDSDDMVVEECYLPEMNNGDWILWENAGAYTSSIKGGFNGFSTTTTYNVISENDRSLLESPTTE